VTVEKREARVAPGQADRPGGLVFRLSLSVRDGPTRRKMEHLHDGERRANSADDAG